MSDIFISYKREDKILAASLAEKLSALGWSVWWDTDIPAGKDYDKFIQKELDASKCVIVLWTERSIESRNVKDEANEALLRDIYIPVLIGNVKPPLGFRMIQGINWNDNNEVEEDKLNSLLKNISYLLGEPPAKEQTKKTKKLKVKSPILDDPPAKEQTKKPKESEIKSPIIKSDKDKSFYQEAGLIFVKGGTFKRENYNVKISDFRIGKYPVTQKLWRDVMGKDPDNLFFKGNDNNPVECVNWYEAIEFCNKFSEKYKLIPYYTIDKNTNDPNNLSDYDKLKYSVTINESSNGFRLPTEAEWEFAAIGGTKSRGYKYAGSNNLDEVGWYGKNSKDTTHPAGQKKANELGIYDMSGNVWEWCYDWYGDYKVWDEENPKGALSGSIRVIRGGSWRSHAGYCRVAYRYYFNADNRGYIGFRLALSS